MGCAHTGMRALHRIIGCLREDLEANAIKCEYSKRCASKVG